MSALPFLSPQNFIVYRQGAELDGSSAVVKSLLSGMGPTVAGWMMVRKEKGCSKGHKSLRAEVYTN